jgi:hypothetical protein
MQDPQQATQYTQQALKMMNEHANNNPEGLNSLFSNFYGRRSRTTTVITSYKIFVSDFIFHFENV